MYLMFIVSAFLPQFYFLAHICVYTTMSLEFPAGEK